MACNVVKLKWVVTVTFGYYNVRFHIFLVVDVVACVLYKACMQF